MKTNLLLFFALLFSVPGFGQDFSNRSGDTLDVADYPADSFTVRRKVYKLGRTKVVLSTVSYDYLGPDNRYFTLWVEQWRKKEMLHSRFFGWMEEEYGFILPTRQSISGFFIIGVEADFSFNTHLISEQGVWYFLPGVERVSIDRASNILYTYAPVENGPHEIGKFAIDSRTLTTKRWDGYGIAWEEIKDEKTLSLLFEHNEPITWEMVKKFPRMQRP